MKLETRKRGRRKKLNAGKPIGLEEEVSSESTFCYTRITEARSASSSNHIRAATIENLEFPLPTAITREYSIFNFGEDPAHTRSFLKQSEIDRKVESFYYLSRT